MDSPIKVPLVDLSAQHASLRSELTAAWFETLERSDFILGEAVGCFEQEFARFVGAAAAVGMGSGLDALRLTLIAMGVAAGDEVIVPANTFIATALAVTE